MQKIFDSGAEIKQLLPNECTVFTALTKFFDGLMSDTKKFNDSFFKRKKKIVEELRSNNAKLDEINN